MSNVHEVNDKRIVQLKEAIVKKKEELGKVQKFIPFTNCSLSFRGNLINIHTLNLITAQDLLIELNTIRLSVNDLGIKIEDYKLGNYNLLEWMSDIKAKMDVLKVKDEEVKLREMERTLDKLMSEAKRTELELDSIAEMLK